MELYISKSDSDRAQAFISNEDLKDFDLDPDGIAKKDINDISRLYELILILRKAGVIQSFFVDDVAVYSNGVVCSMTKDENPSAEDHFFSEIGTKKITDYRPDCDREKNSAGQQGGFRYSHPIPVSKSLTVVTKNMEDMLTCASMLYGKTLFSCLVMRCGEYHLDITLKEEIAKNNSNYVPLWLNLTEYGTPYLRISDGMSRELIGHDAVEKLHGIFVQELPTSQY